MPEYPLALRQKVVSLHLGKGQSLSALSKEFGPSRSTISRWCSAEQERGWFSTGSDTSLFQQLRLNVEGVGQPFDHPTIRKCITIIAQNISSVPLTLYRGDTSDPEQVEQGLWYDLFLRPNPLMTRRELWNAVSTHTMRDGEVFLVLEGAGDEIIGEDEVPSEIWPVSGLHVQEVLEEDQKSLFGWRFNLPGGTIDLPPHAIVQIKAGYNPDNPYRGLSPMSAVMPSFRQDSLASNFNTSYFENGAQVGGVLSTPQALTTEQQEQIRKTWNDRHQGSTKAYRTAVLGNGLKYDGAATSHRDMSWIEQKAFFRQEIASVYGVPLFLLNVEAQSYATASASKRVFWEETLIPILRNFEDTLEARLFSPRSSKADDVDYATFDLSQVSALQDEINPKLEGASKLYTLGYPINDINERLQLGMPEQEHGDVGLLPMGMAPVEDVVDGGSFADLYGPIEEEPSEPVQPIRKTRDQQRRQKRWSQIVRSAFDPVEKRFRKKLGSYIHRRRVEVLQELAATERAAGDGTEEYLAQAKARWDELLKEHVEPIYKYAIAKGAESVGEELGGLKFFEMGDPKVAAFMAEKQVLAERINQTVLDNLRATLVEGMAKRETLKELQDRVRESFNVTRGRAATIARTETAQTVNGARQMAMEAEGVEKVEWVSSVDARTRPSHLALDGAVRSMGESFLPHCTLRHPGDVQCADPREVINCRCTIGPALD